MRFSRHLLVIGSLVIVSAVIYGGTLSYPFVFDDMQTVINNEKIRHPENILKFFFMSDMLDEQYLQIGFYRPFLFATYALNYLASGLDPAPWRLTNITLHVVNGFLLFLVVQRLLSLRGRDSWPWSFLAVLVFTAHPVQTEAVIYNAARSSLLMSTLALASVLLFTHFLASGRKAWIAAALLSYALALFTKETALPVAGVFILLSLAATKDSESCAGVRAWLPISLFGALAVGFAALRALLIGTAPQRYVFHAGTTLSELTSHWAVEVSVIPRYLKLILAPVGLSADHDVPAFRPWGDPFFILGAGLVAAWAWFLVRSMKRDRLLAALLAWPLLSLLTEMVIPIEDKMVEYRVYLALGAGLVLLVYLAAGKLSCLSQTPRKAALLAVALLIVMLGAASWNRARVWESNVSLWRDATLKSPGIARPHANLGMALLQEGKTAEAVAELREALRIRRDFPEALNTLGNALFDLGSFDEAGACYREALQLRPTFADPAFNLGRLSLRQKDYAGAITSFRTAAGLNPRDPLAYHNLAYALTAVGRTAEAIENYKKAAGLVSTHADEHNYNLANIYARAGEFDLARKYYLEALRVNPRHLDSLVNLAGIALSQGRHEEAAELCGRALLIVPDYAPALNILGKARKNAAARL